MQDWVIVIVFKQGLVFFFFFIPGTSQRFAKRKFDVKDEDLICESLLMKGVNNEVSSTLSLRSKFGLIHSNELSADSQECKEDTGDI